MNFQVSSAELGQARAPHELLLFNLMFFHLLLGAATVVLLLTRADYLHSLGHMAFAVPLGASLLIIGYIHFKAHQARGQGSWFVAAHWRLAMGRGRLLLAAYGLTGLILGVGFLVAASAEKPSMQNILLTIATRIGVVPILLAVMVCFVLESSGLYQARRGEVPDSLLKRFPAPADVA